jgi:hypothetical protein
MLALIAELEIESYATTNRPANRGKSRQEAETTSR